MQDSIEQTVSDENNKKNTKKGINIRDICYISLFAAVIVVCSWIAIPISEISITLQTMGVCMAAGFLGWKRGTVCVLCYILLGICCVPVFSGFKNFYALIASASAGYVIGFIFTALIVGFTSDKLHLIGKRVTNNAAKQVVQLIILALAMIAGVAVCYVFGTLWFMLIYKGSVTTSNLQIALSFCVYPYIIPDLIKIVLSTFLVNYLKGYVKLSS
ncbi:MAG: biotin transporter BioY [Candidatus Coproplasma sp.]